MFFCVCQHNQRKWLIFLEDILRETQQYGAILHFCYLLPQDALYALFSLRVFCSTVSEIYLLGF